MLSKRMSDAPYRDFERPGKSEAFGENGMVATSHPQATIAALDILRAGGNAIDAAVCAAAVQAVVEPTQTGIGGDCFALIQRETETAPTALNGSGWSPAKADAAHHRARKETAIDPRSPHAVTVPGSIAAWEKLLADHGTMDFARVLAPAIKFAEEGCCVPERLARDWERQTDKLKANPAANAIFLKHGKPPRPGDVHKQPLLAATLRAVAKRGSEVFYKGELAEHIVSTLQAVGGLHEVEDFAEFAPECVTPISANYRGYDLWECPPSGQGLAVLSMARVLEGFPLGDWNPMGAERLHVQAEAARMAYAERDLFMADPRTGAVPVKSLLSDAHIGKLRGAISLKQRIADIKPFVQVPHRDTVFVSVVDRDRTMVSLINSIFDDFGCGIACPNTGVIFHNRACSFSLEEGHPNALAGRKRPMHTIIPAILAKDGKAVMSFGVTGAHFQPMGQVQILTNVVDYGMPIQAAIDFPRMFALGDTFELERVIPDEVGAKLQAMGHSITRPVNPLGTAQAIFIDRERGILRGGADGRRDGLALAY